MLLGKLYKTGFCESFLTSFEMTVSIFYFQEEVAGGEKTPTTPSTIKKHNALSF
jgi:hypothetical protein